jgi:hypothetical protein
MTCLNSEVTVIEPRDGLTVHVQVWDEDPEQFTLVRIIDEGAHAQD